MSDCSQAAGGRSGRVPRGRGGARRVVCWTPACFENGSWAQKQTKRPSLSQCALCSWDRDSFPSAFHATVRPLTPPPGRRSAGRTGPAESAAWAVGTRPAAPSDRQAHTLWSPRPQTAGLVLMSPPAAASRHGHGAGSPRPLAPALRSCHGHSAESGVHSSGPVVKREPHSCLVERKWDAAQTPGSAAPGMAGV